MSDDLDAKVSKHDQLLTGARHEFEVLPDRVELSAKRDNPEGPVELAGWHFEIEGHQWVYQGALDAKGAASVRVVKANATYAGRIQPPSQQRRAAHAADAAAIAANLDDPGEGPASKRRARVVNEIVGQLKVVVDEIKPKPKH